MQKESNRQKKIAAVLQKDLVDILQGEAREALKGVLITVTKVYVTSDLTEAKVKISVFPSQYSQKLVDAMNKNMATIRYELARRTKHQLRRVPVLHFYSDDSLDYIEKIESVLKGKVDNPIKPSQEEE
jgi:ribosome-binding factor A